MIPPEEAAEPIALARRYAALSAAFEPRDLLEVLGPVSSDLAVAVTANLAGACDTSAESGQWLMRQSVRRRELEQLEGPGQLREVVDWRRGLPTDDGTEDLLDALIGAGPYRPEEMQATIETTEDRTELNRIAVALDRAGQLAPAHAALDAVRSALGRIDVEIRYEAVLGSGFFGREPELATIADWIARPALASPVTALFVTGLPGIGKSTLVEAASHAAATTGAHPAIVVRLDFDRGGLEVQDLVGLTLELSRQVAIALGEEATVLSRARLVAAGAGPMSKRAIKGETRERVPDELAGVLGSVVERSGRTLLVVLDTLEVLRSRGETHPGRLFDFLDQLVDRGARPMSVLAAGRGDALDSSPERRGATIELTGLEPDEADAMLASLDVPPEDFAPIREVADGNPLVLRLAAHVANDVGVAALDGAKGRRDLAAAYLYRFLLSRITDERLSKLAEPGLVVRRINPEVIEEVLAPALRLGTLEPGEAAALFESLSTHHWLVEPDSVPGWVRHRADIRSQLLRLLYESTSAAKAARIDRAAATWFAGRTEAFAPAEAAYHQLQAMRSGRGGPPEIDSYLLHQLDDATIAELPVRAQDLVRASRGERTSKFRAEAPPTITAEDLAHAASELEALLERGDLVEAAYVHERSFASERLSPGSREADIELAFLWRAGRWTEAGALARSQVFTRHDDVGSWTERSPLVALAQLEVWAELRFADLVKRFRRDPGLAAMAAELVAAGIKGGSLGTGALGFALLAGGADRSSTSTLENPVDGAAALWADDATWANGRIRRGRRGALDALAAPSTRFRSLVSPPTDRNDGVPRRGAARLPNPSTQRGAARLLATSTPYGPVAEAVRRSAGDKLLSHLGGTDFELAERGGLPPSGAGGWSIAPSVSPDGSIENLGALGLLAEWLGAAAFVLRHGDLRQIAHRAERWRRTVAGDWAYPAPPGTSGEPTGWQRRPDPTLADRIEQLRSAKDPPAASLDHLRLWWGGEIDPDTDLVARIERRAPKAFDAAAAEASSGSAAGASARAALTLQAHGLPSAFVPPLAVLIASQRGNRRRP